MAENLIENHKTISKLPFAGFVVVGNSFTDLVMKENTKVSYEHMWNELKGLKGLYKNKIHNFLQINIHFPADFWDDVAWTQVSENFTIVATIAKDLGFKGIVFDDEPYSISAKKMVNFKFPENTEPKWVDKNAYVNKKYTFPLHMKQVTHRFKAIMTSMTNVYPKLVTLVYLGPSLSHINSNMNYPIVIDMGLPRENEYHGAIFTGLKQGLNAQSKLHDMGESYKYREDKHFKHAYQWRKYDMAKDTYNDHLNSKTQWIVPESERKTWSTEVNVGFMVFNKGQKSSYPEFTTLNSSSVQDIEQTLYKALKYSDEYVIFYPEEQDWLLPNKKYPLPSSWMKMMQRVYSNN